MFVEICDDANILEDRGASNPVVRISCFFCHFSPFEMIYLQLERLLTWEKLRSQIFEIQAHASSYIAKKEEERISYCGSFC